jgi:predicted nucleic acid-binding protein
MSIWVIDTSVAVKWFLDEPHAELATALLAPGHRLHAPTLLSLEFDNVMATHVRRGILQPDEALSIRAGLKRIPLQYHDVADLRDSAFDLALECRKSIYDCCFLSLARTLGAYMITDDGRFLRNLPGFLDQWTFPLGQLEP